MQNSFKLSSRIAIAGLTLAALAPSLSAAPLVAIGVDKVPAAIRFGFTEAALGLSAINSKAAGLGSGFTGREISALETVKGGYRKRYENCDIYYSNATDAHEVHGDIRAKYNAKGGPNSDLGLPITDETGTPDGQGRYNHFYTNGSIYWHPNTGPMEVHGGIRWAWSGQGWELGPLGYPTTDERVVGASQWVSEFQNGVVYWDSAGQKGTPVAGLSRDRLAAAVRRLFEQSKGDGDLKVGSLGISAVSDTGYGFWESRNRLVTFHIHGWYDNGWLPDTDYDMDLRLLFAADRHGDGSRSLSVRLDHWYIHTSGLGNGKLLRGLKDGVLKLFTTPLALGDIPADVEVLAVKVMKDGALNIYVKPNVSNGFDLGNLRRYFIQQKLDQFVDGE